MESDLDLTDGAGGRNSRHRQCRRDFWRSAEQRIQLHCNSATECDRCFAKLCISRIDGDRPRYEPWCFPGASTVTFNGTAATISGAWTDTSILVIGAVDSKWTSIRRGDGQQSAQQQRIVHGSSPPSNSPTINSFTPTSGTFGTTVTINGAFFSNAIDVKFNGTPAASFHVDSSTQITAIVPAGVTTGPISVTNTAGTTASSTNFTVSLIKLSTFENGTLTDPATGVTSTSGSGVSIETISPLKGQFSGHVTAGSSWLQDTFAGKDDVYASFYLRLNALPSGAVRIAMFSDSGTTVETSISLPRER